MPALLFLVLWAISAPTLLSLPASTSWASLGMATLLVVLWTGMALWVDLAVLALSAGKDLTWCVLAFRDSSARMASPDRAVLAHSLHSMGPLTALCLDLTSSTLRGLRI